jgi:hypothetical protein
LAPSATAAPTLSAASGALTESALAQAWLAANRIMYGPRAGDLERIARMGLDAFVDEQLAAAAEPEDAEVQRRLAPLDTLSKTPGQILEKYSGDPRGPGSGVTSCLTCSSRRNSRGLAGANSIVMVDWNNHFNVGFNKSSTTCSSPMMTAVPFVHMRWEHELLGASAKSPAVLQSLDKESNVRGNINENYGRELLELHTVGADNGYTQQDVLDAARAFTGWSINTLREDAGKAGTFMYRPRAHDEDAKTVMGLRIPANGGIKDGEALLDFLAVHPNTARTLSLKLCRRFIADAPAESLTGAVTHSQQGRYQSNSERHLRGQFKASFGRRSSARSNMSRRPCAPSTLIQRRSRACSRPWRRWGSRSSCGSRRMDFPILRAPIWAPVRFWPAGTSRWISPTPHTRKPGSSWTRWRGR